jgi:hypothetical protein
MDLKRAILEAINYHMGNATVVTTISMERRG